MTAASRRVSSLIDRYGEDFTVGGNPHRGVFSNIAPGQARAYLTQAEVDASALPLWTCLVADDDTTAVGNTVVWNSLSLTVKKIAQAQFQGALVAKMLVMTG
ncbi:MAG: hypothetical protein JSS66_02180 [Armatimonadetes bacterium]|nr:hypothetical protein [Armatimonadota bacterium]